MKFNKALLVFLLAAAPALASEASPVCHSGLWSAVSRNDLQNFNRFLPLQDNVNCVDNQSNTLFSQALFRSNLDIVKKLVERGADIHALSWGVPHFHFAAISGDLQRIQYLIDQGADVNVQDSSGDNCLSRVISWRRGNYKEVVLYLIDRGVSVEHSALYTLLIGDFDDKTAELFEEILPRLEPSTAYGGTKLPLHFYVAKNTSSGRSLLAMLHLPERYNFSQVFTYKEGETVCAVNPLHFYMRKDQSQYYTESSVEIDTRMIAQMLKQGLDLNMVDSCYNEFSILQYVVRKLFHVSKYPDHSNYKSVIKKGLTLIDYLIKQGADVNWAGVSGKRLQVVEYDAAENLEELTEMFCRAGAISLRCK